MSDTSRFTRISDFGRSAMNIRQAAARGLFGLTTAAVGAAIGIVSPARSMRYRYGRQMLAQFKERAYTAARKGGANQLWNPTNKTGDSELRTDAARVLARARDLARNNQYVAGAIQTFVANVVGTGIIPQACVMTAQGKSDTEFNAAAEALFADWAEREDYYEKQRLTMRHEFVDGEILGHYIARPLEDNLPPFGVQLLECDQLDTHLDGQMYDGNIIYRGIELNRYAEPAAYWVLDYHPGDSFSYRRNYKSTRIPAGEMLHVFRKERVTQTRGISRLAPVVAVLYDLAEYQDYEMIGAKLAAAFGVFIKQTHPEFLPPPQQQYGGKVAGDKKTRLEYIEPGKIERLAPGEEIEIASHNRPGNAYDPFVRGNLRGAATGVGMSYEAFSGDYSTATYSSARSATLEERRKYRLAQQLQTDRLNLSTWRRFMAYSVASGLLKAPGYIASPRRYAAVRFVAPGWEWVDPEKDAKAATLELAIGVTTRQKIAAMRGEDIEDILIQLAREEALAMKHGLDIRPAKKTTETKDDSKDEPDDSKDDSDDPKQQSDNQKQAA